MQADESVNGPILVFLVPVGQGSAATAPVHPIGLPVGLPIELNLPTGLPMLSPPAAGDCESHRPVRSIASCAKRYPTHLHPPTPPFAVFFSGSFGLADLAIGLSMQDLVGLFKV